MQQVKAFDKWRPQNHLTYAENPERQPSSSPSVPTEYRFMRSMQMEYQVVEAHGDAQKLQVAVNEQLQDGWELQGGVAVGYSPQSMTWWYYQAMVRTQA
ncbi:hypothetical protein BH10PLA2_BH10PLA2_22270 [soil metagenome]